MAYHLEDENNRDIGSGPSINGLRQLKAFFAKQEQSSYPALSMLIEEGATHLTKPLAVECRTLASKCKDDDVKSTLKSTAASASNAKGIVMLVSHSI